MSKLKATIEYGPTMFAVMFFMVGIFIGSYFLLGSLTTVAKDLAKPSYSKLATLDSSYQLVNCLSEKSIITLESLQQKKDDCKQKSGLDYLEIRDVATGISYASGSSVAGTDYTSYSNMKVNGENHQIRIYVQKS